MQTEKESETPPPTQLHPKRRGFAFPSELEPLFKELMGLALQAGRWPAYEMLTHLMTTLRQVDLDNG